MEGKIENVKLKVLTPIYIGGDGTKNLKSLDYYYDKTKNVVKVLNKEKFISYIIKNRKYEAFIREVNNCVKLEQILTKLQIDVNELIYKEEIGIDEVVIKKGKETLNDINRFVVDGNNNIYIPGSSIKGSIVLAIKYNYLLKKSINISEEKNIDKMFSLREEDGKDSKIGQYISVPDVYLNDYKTYIAPKIDITVKKNKQGVLNSKESALPIYREYIEPCAEVVFEMKVDYDGLKKWGINNFKDIADALNNKINNSFELEKVLLEKYSGEVYYSEETQLKPNMCLGGGVGYHSKSILSALTPLNRIENLTKEVKMRLDKKFSKHEHMRHDDILSPRTIKIAKHNGRNLVVGMCKLEKVD